VVGNLAVDGVVGVGVEGDEAGGEARGGGGGVDGCGDGDSQVVGEAAPGACGCG